MVLPGETAGGLPATICEDCMMLMILRVCRSGAGYYLGYICPQHGPYSRESGYFKSKAEATEALESDQWERR